MDLFYELNKQGSTIIMITHDREIGEAAARQIVIRDGNIVQDWRLIVNTSENIRMALSSIFAHKMRSILTMLGIIIGISAIITIISMGDGTNAKFKKS